MDRNITIAILVLAMILAMFCATGCMSKNEMYLRMKDIENQANHPPTYQVLTIKGPLNIPEGGELVIQAPTQPFVHANIPNGQEYQLKALNTAAITGAAIAGGYYIKRAAGKGGDTTINNNAQPSE